MAVVGNGEQGVVTFACRCDEIKVSTGFEPSALYIEMCVFFEWGWEHKTGIAEASQNPIN